MRIAPIIMLSEHKTHEKAQPLNKQEIHTQHKNYTTIVPQYNDYLLSFGARVDKGLERFYEVNKDIMPDRVREYIEKLPDKSAETPLEAQRNAYEYLKIADNVEDVKGVYKEFEGLKEANKTKATTGILYDIKNFSDMLEADGKSVLKGKKDFTVYLVKKIYLENQSLDEINQALENDLEPDFKSAYRYHNTDAQFVHLSTFPALGIPTPNQHYRNSLRYTREGYSDMMSEKLTSFWNSLSDEERTARAQKSVANFENWWASIPHDKKLDLLIEQDSELSMLEEYKAGKLKSQAKKETAPTTTPVSATQASQPVRAPRTHVGSTKLSQDELFIKWATNNLKIFNESLTDADKTQLDIKRTQALMNRWNVMTPAERTEYLVKLKTGQEPLRFTMIDAWNHSFDIIVDLSKHLTQKHVERKRTIDILYSKEPFSEYQSRIMTEFWAKHPEHAKHLGEEIHNSHLKVQDAIKNGRFEILKQKIMRARNKRIKELQAIKFKFTTPEVTREQSPKAPTTRLQTIPQAPSDAHLSESAKELKELYKRYPFMTSTYIDDIINAFDSVFTPEEMAVVVKEEKHESLTAEERLIQQQLAQKHEILSVKTRPFNEAQEKVLKDTISRCVKRNDIYTIDYNDIPKLFLQIYEGSKTVSYYSPRERTIVSTSVIKPNINLEKIDAGYKVIRNIFKNLK